MDYDDAVEVVLEDAASIIPRGGKLDVVTRVRRDFAKQGYCDHSLVEKIEKALRERLSRWSRDEKRGIWESLAFITSRDDSADRFEDYPDDSIDMFLEGELMALITERLSPSGPKRRRDVDAIYNEE